MVLRSSAISAPLRRHEQHRSAQQTQLIRVSAVESTWQVTGLGQSSQACLECWPVCGLPEHNHLQALACNCCCLQQALSCMTETCLSEYAVLAACNAWNMQSSAPGLAPTHAMCISPSQLYSKYISNSSNAIGKISARNCTNTPAGEL